MNFLKGKTAIVTGGSGTIGKAIAKALLSQGCNVFITGRNQQRLDVTAAELSSDNSSSGKLKTFSGDVCNEEQIASLFDSVEKEFGCTDLLVNNAGTAIPGETTEHSVEDFNQVMRVNVTGPFICSKECMKRMRNREKGGRIVNIGSLSASTPRPDSVSYTTSKFALNGLSRSLSMDCRKDNIAVGIIHPGNVMSNLLTPEVIAERSKSEGFMTAEDVANSVLTMCSLPYSANVLEMTVLPTNQPLVGRG